MPRALTARRTVALLLMLCLLAPFVLAEMPDQEAVTAGLLAFLKGSPAWDGYTLSSSCIPEKSDTLFAVFRKGKVNVLCRFEKQGDVWALMWQGSACVPQDRPLALMSFGVEDFLVYQPLKDTDFRHALQWRKVADGWQMVGYQDTDIPMSVEVHADHMVFSQPSFHSWIIGLAYVDTDVQMETFQFHRLLDDIGINYNALTGGQPVVLPTLEKQATALVPGKYMPVYTHPQKNSPRAGDGQGQVGTSSTVDVYGSVDGYLLVGYRINSEKGRIGYIEASAMAVNSPTKNISFAQLEGRVIVPVELTDDPLHSGAAVGTLARDTAVTCLALLGEWVYIDTGKMRGFVKGGQLCEASQSSAWYKTFDSPTYSAEVMLRWEIDGAYTVTVHANGQTPPSAYRVYFNGTLVSTAPIHAEEPTVMSGKRPNHPSVMGICPVDSQGKPIAKDTILFRLP